MITIENLQHRYGETILFNSVSAQIGDADRIGLVGPNGAGKTTLLEFLAGRFEPDAGRVNAARECDVGYLPQEEILDTDRSVYDETESAFDEIQQLRSDLASASRRLHTLGHETAEYRNLLERIGTWEHRLEELEESKARSRVEAVLLGLGFQIEDLPRSVRTFSGGWQMRIALGKLLLREPALLMLDEPTNHLDLDSLRWLENYLTAYAGAIVIVSHDRRFLDAICTRIFALEHGRLESYTGNYSQYESESQRRREQRLQAQKSQERSLAQTERFIERFRYQATKARQVQSRIKALNKVERITVETEADGIHFRFPDPPRSGRSVLQLDGLSKSYGSNTVFQDLDLEVERGERVAIVGRNGAGKSTLTRILAGNEDFERGERVVGHNVTVSYFAQHQAESLQPDQTVLEAASEQQPEEIRKQLRTLLGAFLFKGDAVFKRVRVLSGGEKNRLALVRMLLQRSNCLILDEPTNHLDMRSKSVLQEALREWRGTLLIVSHDRDFLDPLVSRVWDVRNGGVRDFPGTLSEYIARCEEDEARVANPPAARADAGTAPSASGRLRRRRQAAGRQQRASLRKEIAEVESRITELESHIGNWETELADPEFFRNGARTTEGLRAYHDAKAELSDAYTRWEKLTAALESKTANDD